VVLGMISSNPAKIVGNVKKSKKEIDFWTKEEFEKVVKTFYVEDYYQNFSFICIWLLFMTGMRIGEATALTWKDVNLDRRYLT
ncbi:tyrosine-type recombinase/integrase, partial [Enterococcus faecalis]|nr:tyrosine-type recombinase/integrase [Enterococcus faecalis]